MFSSSAIWLSIIIQIFVIFNVVSCSYSYYIEVLTSAPAVQGANVTFEAHLKDENGYAPAFGKLDWEWKIKGMFEQKMETSGTNVAVWTQYFPRDKCPPGEYRVDVAAFDFVVWIEREIAKTSKSFDITSILNGELFLSQNGTVRETNFISSAVPLNQTIKLNAADAASLANATYMTTYWFVDCQYVGQSDEMFAMNHFKHENSSHNIEALVVAAFEPRPVPMTTTTTTTTTTTPAPTTTTPKTTTPAPTTTSTSSTTPKPKQNEPAASAYSAANTTLVHSVRKREINQSSAQMQIVELLSQNNEIDTKNVVNGNSTISYDHISPTTHMPTSDESRQPFVCFNKSAVAPDPKKIYGYFSKDVIVRNPLTNVTVSGSSWLKHGEVLQLEVKCAGSPPFEYCSKVITGAYNTTGNETCDGVWFSPETCEFSIIHYFGDVQPYTILIFIKNQVTVLTKVVTINIYNVKKQSQLSVIVVPVVFILFAITSVIFGVAKYVQTKNRFSVEVADFNFGETSSVDLEYKTFHRRLLDSIRELISRHPMSTNEIESTDSSLRYGTMT